MVQDCSVYNLLLPDMCQDESATEESLQKNIFQRLISTPVRPRAIAAPLWAAALLMSSPLAMAAGAYDDVLSFDPDSYSSLGLMLDGAAVPLNCGDAAPLGVGPGGGEPSPERRPLEAPSGYQTMYIFAPEAALDDDATAIMLYATRRLVCQWPR